MATWAIGLMVAGASLLMIFFTYFACQTVYQIEESLTWWAWQHGYHIIAKEERQLFVGPFKINKCCPTYYITVEDRTKKLTEPLGVRLRQSILTPGHPRRPSWSIQPLLSGSLPQP